MIVLLKTFLFVGIIAVSVLFLYIIGWYLGRRNLFVPGGKNATIILIALTILGGIPALLYIPHIPSIMDTGKDGVDAGVWLMIGSFVSNAITIMNGAKSGQKSITKEVLKKP
ncbi:MAG: hypothetical protein WCQ32_01420 [bacterium]